MHFCLVVKLPDTVSDSITTTHPSITLHSGSKFALLVHLCVRLPLQCDLSEAQARCKHEWMRQALIAMQGQMATSSGMPLPQLATIQAAQGQQQQLDTGSLASASSDTTAVGP